MYRCMYVYAGINLWLLFLRRGCVLFNGFRFNIKLLYVTILSVQQNFSFQDSTEFLRISYTIDPSDQTSNNSAIMERKELQKFEYLLKPMKQ